MEITDVKFRKLFDARPLCAICSVTFDDCFTVHDIKVISAGNAVFTVMPNKKNKDGSTSDVAHPIKREFRKELEEKILIAYAAARENENASIKEDKL